MTSKLEIYTEVLPQGMEFNMIEVKGGKFLMGDESQDAFNSEKPIHEVEVSDFYIGQYQVTQELWQTVMKINPARFSGVRHPIECISWYDAVLFCNHLSSLKGYKPAYKVYYNTKDSNNLNSTDELQWLIKWNKLANGYRLPTEGEWEYAARGGKYSRDYSFSGSNDLKEISWNFYNSHRMTQEVGLKIPNELGLFDMSGNMFEWCWDWLGPYSEFKVKNPEGFEYGEFRAIRGGSWLSRSQFCRVSCRGIDNSRCDVGNLVRGLRLSRTAL